MKTIMLCGAEPKGCCPEIYIDYDTVSIKNDDGDMISMSTTAFKILKQKIINGEFDKYI